MNGVRDLCKGAMRDGYTIVHGLLMKVVHLTAKPYLYIYIPYYRVFGSLSSNEQKGGDRYPILGSENVLICRIQVGDKTP